METEMIYGKFVMVGKDGQDGNSFEIKTSDVFIGRDAKCQIPIESKSVSRKHAKVIIGMFFKLHFSFSFFSKLIFS